MDFNSLVKFFDKLGYPMEVDSDFGEDNFRFATHRGDIRIMFSEESLGYMYKEANLRIAMDRDDCFDKWSKVPVSLPFPETPEHLEFIKKTIKWLKSPAGYNTSNYYIHDAYVLEYKEDI